MDTLDKVQTALEIGRSANLIKRTDEIVMMTSDDKDEVMEIINKLYEELVAKNSIPPENKKSPISWIKDVWKNTSQTKEIKKVSGKVICITGENVEWILENDDLKFIKVCNEVNAVLCCRTTPKLKGEVVSRYFRNFEFFNVIHV